MLEPVGFREDPLERGQVPVDVVQDPEHHSIGSQV